MAAQPHPPLTYSSFSTQAPIPLAGATVRLPIAGGVEVGCMELLCSLRGDLGLLFTGWLQRHKGHILAAPNQQQAGKSMGNSALQNRSHLPARV